GLMGGFDLRRHENLTLSPALAQPKEVYVPTRVLLAPSLIAESGGRVAVEALLNGIPPIVSDRGGLPEVCNGAGFSIPMRKEIGPNYPAPVPAEDVAPWVELIARLEDDQDFYAAESAKARAAGEMYRPENLAPRYVEFFRRVADA
ncbi:MAG TPA: glycosyltransferase, partial [Bryobacteraceae bacterium]|nr:glycosyltransferase [Bryobacteraceae bacterium]